MSNTAATTERASLTAYALSATQAAHFVSGKALNFASMETLVALVAFVALGSLWTLGCLVGAAQMSTFTTDASFVVSKWLLGLVCIDLIFMLTHLPLFTRYFLTVRKMQAMIEEQTGEKLEVNYKRLTAQVLGLRYLRHKIDPDCLGHLSYKGLHFNHEAPGTLYSLRENADGESTKVSTDNPQQEDPQYPFIMAVKNLSKNPKYVDLHNAAKESVLDVG